MINYYFFKTLSKAMHYGMGKGESGIKINLVLIDSITQSNSLIKGYFILKVGSRMIFKFHLEPPKMKKLCWSIYFVEKSLLGKSRTLV